MRSVVLAQQQAVLARRVSGLLPYVNPWRWWTPEQIARITNTPVQNVLDNWPIVAAALAAYGVYDYDTVRAVLATTAIETAHTFQPVEEAFWLDDGWRWRNLRYAPYWGRGYIQLTWEDNYEYYGDRIGHPELVDNPALAMQPLIAAQLLAVFIADHDIQQVAQAHDWRETRRLVQGGDAGLTEYIQMIEALGAEAAA